MRGVGIVLRTMHIYGWGWCWAANNVHVCGFGVVLGQGTYIWILHAREDLCVLTSMYTDNHDNAATTYKDVCVSKLVEESSVNKRVY